MGAEITVRIPGPLRQFTDGSGELRVEATSVDELIANVAAKGYASLVNHICTRDGQLRPFVNLYLGSDSVRALNGLKTRLAAGDVITILPAVAGG